ncbi:hypothetical protein OQA88_10926 [Cercophora sp. LCS_1]
MADAELVDYGPLLNLLIWVLAGAATLFLGLRIWTKRQRRIRLWHDDQILIVAWTSLVLSCILQTVDTQIGFGRSHDGLDADTIVTARLVSIVAGFFLILAATWSKTSFAVTLLRISEGWHRKVVIFVIVTVNLAHAVSCVVQWIQCWPVQRLWMQDLPGSCLSLDLVNGYNMFVAGYSGLMDLGLALLPWLILRSTTNPLVSSWPSTKLRKSEMLNVSLAMSMAVFAGIASFAKIWAIHQINYINAQPEHIVVLMVLGTAEGAVTIMAVSVPVLRSLGTAAEEENVENQQQGDAGRGEDRGGDDQGPVGLVEGQGEAEGEGGYADCAEGDEDAGRGEVGGDGHRGLAFVVEEERQVDEEGEEEEEEEDGEDGDVGEGSWRGC